MEGGKSGKRRRGPPKSKRERSPPSRTPPEEESEGGEWYDDVVDETQPSGGGFGGFSVKRPQMSSTDQVEGQHLERYLQILAKKEFPIDSPFLRYLNYLD